MFLPSPQLDDTRWADLVEEGLALIPFHAPEWTDHNASDPGITIVELLASIAEMQVFQLDQVPERHRRAFLALVGVRPLPPRPARTVLRFAVPDGSAPVALPAGVACAGDRGRGDIVGFRTRHPLQVVAGAVDGLQAVDASGSADLTGRWQRGEPVAPFGADPRAGAALVLALTAPPPVGVTLTLAVATTSGRGGEAPGRHHDAAVAWETLGADGRWAATTVVADGTRSLTRDGRVELRVAGPSLATPTPAGPRWLLRVRLASGRYDDTVWLRDVALNGALAEQAVAVTGAWDIAPGATVAGTPTPGTDVHLEMTLDAAGTIVALDVDGASGPPVRVLAYRTPAPGAPGELVLAARPLGRSTGDPAQRFTMPSPVDVTGLHLFAGHGARWRRFTVRGDLIASGADDAHALLDPTTGRITFGDGWHGAVPPAGDVVLVVGRTTRAAEGDVPAGTVDRLASGAPPGLAVVQPRAATGGAAQQTLGEAEAWAAAQVTGPTRAVTLADTEALALQTPGTRIARVVAVGDRHPAFPCVTATGFVTVVVVPHLPVGRPAPSPGLLRAVAVALRPHRLVGTRIEVSGPTYVTVSIRATVAAFRGAVTADVRGRVAAALDAFLDPLRGGPAGTGWPFGRDVVRTEVLHVIDDVPGVDHVVEIELLGPDGASCGNLCLGELELVAPGEHAIAVVIA